MKQPTDITLSTNRQEEQIKITVRKKSPPFLWAKCKRVWAHWALCYSEINPSYTGEGADWSGFSGKSAFFDLTVSQVYLIEVKTLFFTCAKMLFYHLKNYNKELKNICMTNNRERAEQVAKCLYCAIYDICWKEYFGLNVWIRNNRLIKKGTFWRDVNSIITLKHVFVWL